MLISEVRTNYSCKVEMSGKNEAELSGQLMQIVSLNCSSVQSLSKSSLLLSTTVSKADNKQV